MGKTTLVSAGPFLKLWSPLEHPNLFSRVHQAAAQPRGPSTLLAQHSQPARLPSTSPFGHRHVGPAGQPFFPPHFFPFLCRSPP
jgi:hypothetical protein